MAGEPRWRNGSETAPHDLIWIVYCGLILLLLIILGPGAGRVEHPLPLIGVHLLLLAAGTAARFLPRWWNHPIARFVRWWYPMILLLVCFEALGHMVHIIRPELIDGWLVRMDRLIFGVYPTLVLQDLARPWLTEISYICYTSFYLYVPAIGIPLWLRARRSRPEEAVRPAVPGGEVTDPAFVEFMTAVTLAMYGCFLLFLLTPAGGPIFWPDYPGEVLHLPGGPITALEQWIFDTGTIVGGAFPSSHVALAVTAAASAVRYGIAPRLFIPLTIGLGLSTVYNGYHYGVDVLYGMGVAVVVIFATPRLTRWWQKIAR